MPPSKTTESSEQLDRYRPGFLDSATFFATTSKPTWLVNKILVADQPCILGGPKKCLKTSVVIDLALSLASGTPFLGAFPAKRSACVALLSGESGEWATAETAKRICRVRGIDPHAVHVLWGFKLPQLASVLHLQDLRDELRQNGVKVLILDPLYLSLLAGPDAKGLDAANLYQTGPLLMAVAQTCLAVNCTPILIHHARKNLTDPHQPLDLEDLAYSGVQEFARQWLLINRRERYDPDNPGVHRLWLSAGGSVGHGGCWAVDVEEGELDERFDGRRWTVFVRKASEARQEQVAKKNEEKDRQEQDRIRADGEKVLAAVDDLADESGVAAWTRVRAAVRMSNERLTRTVMLLRADGVLEECQAEIATGRNLRVRKTVHGLRRVSRAPNRERGASDGTDGTHMLPFPGPVSRVSDGTAAPIRGGPAHSLTQRYEDI